MQMLIIEQKEYNNLVIKVIGYLETRQTTVIGTK